MKIILLGLTLLASISSFAFETGVKNNTEGNAVVKCTRSVPYGLELACGSSLFLRINN